MEIPHKFNLTELVESLYYCPNGKEFICKLCSRIEYSKDRIYLHIYNKQVRDLE